MHHLGEVLDSESQDMPVPIFQNIVLESEVEVHLEPGVLTKKLLLLQRSYRLLILSLVPPQLVHRSFGLTEILLQQLVLRLQFPHLLCFCSSLQLLRGVVPLPFLVFVQKKGVSSSKGGDSCIFSDTASISFERRVITLD